MRGEDRKQKMRASTMEEELQNDTVVEGEEAEEEAAEALSPFSLSRVGKGQIPRERQIT